MPAFFERMQRRIQQHDTRQHRRSREVPRIGRMISRDRQSRNDHGRFIAEAASERKESCGSLPVSLRGSECTNSSGRGMNTVSIRLRSCSVNAPASRDGATDDCRNPGHSCRSTLIGLADEKRAIHDAWNGV